VQDSAVAGLFFWRTGLAVERKNQRPLKWFKNLLAYPKEKEAKIYTCRLRNVFSQQQQQQQ
jgi:hypothetical protein